MNCLHCMGATKPVADEPTPYPMFYAGAHKQTYLYLQCSANKTLEEVLFFAPFLNVNYITKI